METLEVESLRLISLLLRRPSTDLSFSLLSMSISLSFPDRVLNSDFDRSNRLKRRSSFLSSRYFASSSLFFRRWCICQIQYIVAMTMPRHTTTPIAMCFAEELSVVDADFGGGWLALSIPHEIESILWKYSRRLPSLISLGRIPLIFNKERKTSRWASHARLMESMYSSADVPTGYAPLTSRLNLISPSASAPSMRCRRSIRVPLCPDFASRMTPNTAIFPVNLSRNRCVVSSKYLTWTSSIILPTGKPLKRTCMWVETLSIPMLAMSFCVGRVSRIVSITFVAVSALYNIDCTLLVSNAFIWENRTVLRRTIGVHSFQSLGQSPMKWKEAEN